MKDLDQKLMELSGNFNSDPEVKRIVTELKSKLEKMTDETFTKAEQDSDKFSDLNERFYFQLKETDPDDFSIFDFIWFK